MKTPSISPQVGNDGQMLTSKGDGVASAAFRPSLRPNMMVDGVLHEDSSEEL